MKRVLAMILMFGLLLAMTACGGVDPSEAAVSAESAASTVETAPEPEVVPAEEVSAEESSVAEEPAAPAYEPTREELEQRAAIEEALNLRNNPDQTWTYSASGDGWVLSVVPAVVNPELPDNQGVSVCVPGAYVVGIDTDGDGAPDVTAADGEAPVWGSLVIDYQAQVVSSNGQIYTAATAPTIFTTGAMGYSAQTNSTASTGYAAEGYLTMTCGNRGKQSTITDEAGNVVSYTGDAPSCLVDQKAAVRFVKYNMLLGNLPGSIHHFVTTGGSGGAAHASMFAATSNHPDFYDYQIEAGAVGVYQNSDGSYSTAVTIDGEPVVISDGAWGSVAYSTISSLYEADMAQAFEYCLDPTYEFNTSFQEKLAEYLAHSYMEYINGQNLSVEENRVGFDLNQDGDTEDLISLTLEYDPEKYPETGGYSGTYLDLYLAEFTGSLQQYVDALACGAGWTWFDETGAPLSDSAVAEMTDEDRTIAFVEGRYAKGSSGGMGGPGGMGGTPDGGPMDGGPPDLFGDGIRDGGPMMGTTGAAGGGADSGNYSTFEEMVSAYEADITAIEAGDDYGNNIVDLYNPLNYIGAEGTENPAWTRIVMGAKEGDIAMMCSLNLELKWLSAGTHAVIEWQWDGSHVPSEVLGDSLSLYVDEMYGMFAGGETVEKPEPEPQTANGTATEPTGTDISGWVTVENGEVSFALQDVMVYRNTGASKAVPGFDVIDYGQEDYVFGSDSQDARHWNHYLLEIFKAHGEELGELFRGQ